MYFEQYTFERERAYLQEKGENLQKIRQEVDKIIDAEGLPIDSNIKETVIALMALDFPASASCEGHLEKEHGFGAPWVEITAPNQPEERFIGEKEVYQRIAEKYKVPLEDVRRGKHYKSYKEAVNEASKSDETPEYKKWRQENRKLMKRAEEVLAEFYKNRKVPSNVHLEIEKFGEGDYFRIYNGGEDYKAEKKELTEEQIKIKKERLKDCQKEMQEFAEFLEKKYFAS